MQGADFGMMTMCRLVYNSLAALGTRPHCFVSGLNWSKQGRGLIANRLFIAAIDQSEHYLQGDSGLHGEPPEVQKFI